MEDRMAPKTFDDYAGKDYVILIPSKGRSKRASIVQRVFPNGVLYVNHEEFDAYRQNCTLEIITHTETQGIGSVNNSIFAGAKKAKIRYSAILDDDIDDFCSLVGNRPRLLTAEQVELAIVNGCQVLEDLGAYMFLFSTSSSIVKYQQHEPYKVGFSLPQGTFIVRNDKIGRFRLGMHHYEDFDFCMDYVMKHRFMVIESRYLPMSRGTFVEGGCNSFKTAANEAASKEYLLKKWKRYVTFTVNMSGVTRPAPNFTMKQR